MLVSPSRIHYSSLESLEGFFQLFRDIRWWVQWWQYDRKKKSHFFTSFTSIHILTAFSHAYEQRVGYFCCWISHFNFFSNNFLKCILSLFIPQHHKIDKVSFDTSKISLLMMLSFWTYYQSFLSTYWHFNLLASEVKSSVSLFNKDDINICHVCSLYLFFPEKSE